MQFTDNVGIQGTKQEFAALLDYCSDASENFTGVSIKIENGRLVAWATNGHAAIYHHGQTWDGAGKPSRSDDSWKIPADTLKTIVRACENRDEIIISLTKKRTLKDALIRDIETSTERGRFDLSNTETSGELFKIDHIVPSRPDRNSVAVGCLNIAPSLLYMLRKVAKSTGTDSCRIWMPSSGNGPLYVEVDSPTALMDEEQPRWIVVLMPLSDPSEAKPRGTSEEEPEE